MNESLIACFLLESWNKIFNYFISFFASINTSFGIFCLRIGQFFKSQLIFIFNSKSSHRFHANIPCLIKSSDFKWKIVKKKNVIMIDDSLMSYLDIKAIFLHSSKAFLLNIWLFYHCRRWWVIKKWNLRIRNAFAIWKIEIHGMSWICHLVKGPIFARHSRGFIYISFQNKSVDWKENIAGKKLMKTWSAIINGSLHLNWSNIRATLSLWRSEKTSKGLFPWSLQGVSAVRFKFLTN